MWADPIVTKYISGRPSTVQQTWSRLLTYVGHWNLMGFGYWAIEEKSSGDFVGEAGLADFKRDIAASMKGSPELGFALVPRVHGKGYATEAVRGVLSWADVNIAQAQERVLGEPAKRSLASCRREMRLRSLRREPLQRATGSVLIAYRGAKGDVYTRLIGGGFQRPSSA